MKDGAQSQPTNWRAWPVIRVLAVCLSVWGGASAQAQSEAQLAIIIDDIGYSAMLGQRSLALPGAFTYAVLPLAPHGPRLARQAADAGKEIMIHNPMSNIQGLPLDAGALSGDMDWHNFSTTLTDNIDALPEARGLNNHMGSQLTQEAAPMGWLMEQLSARGLYFIDSRTTADSRAWETAQRYQVPSLERDVFLDHERDPEQIARQLDQAIALARTRGYAIAIGHPYPETLEVLEQLQPKLDAAQVTLVSVSELLQNRPESLRQAPGDDCPAPPEPLWHRPAHKGNPPDLEGWLKLPIS